MSYPSSVYAKALREILAERPNKDFPSIIDGWLRLIKKSGDYKRLEAIMNEVQKQNDLAAGLCRAKLSSAYKMDSEAMKIITETVLKQTKVKEVVWEQVLEPELLGGVIIRYEDKVIEADLRHKLLSLKKAILAPVERELKV
ncbi:MAG: F0F1 ATP synthase subunit delta [Patescibacteria group bacterium]|nr:MAG: F0F1 ATP synthase subunit delta [Patescibacteria group bacterium]